MRGPWITAVTAQNHRGLRMMQPVGTEMLMAQLDTFSKPTPRRCKIGLVPDDESADIIAGVLTRFGARNIVVDPVMGATCGGIFGDSPAPENGSGRLRL